MPTRTRKLVCLRTVYPKVKYLVNLKIVKERVPIKAALTKQKKVIKTGSIFMDRGMDRGTDRGSAGAWEVREGG